MREFRVSDRLEGRKLNIVPDALNTDSETVKRRKKDDPSEYTGYFGDTEIINLSSYFGDKRIIEDLMTPLPDINSLPHDDEIAKPMDTHPTEMEESLENEKKEEIKEEAEIVLFPKKKVRHSRPSDALLIVSVLLLFAFFLLYGKSINELTLDSPFKEKDNSISGLVVTAVTSIREGKLPWNYREIIEDENQTFLAYSTKYVGESGMLSQSVTAPEEPETGSAKDNTNSTSDNMAGGYVKEESHGAEAGGEIQQEEHVVPITENIYMEVSDDYFSDAIFLGDSRFVGLGLYSGMSEGTFYSKTSMTIFGLLDTEISTDLGTAREELSRNQYEKVYIQVGINEVGTGDIDYYTNYYRGVIEQIIELQPDAIIYITAIMHVTKAKDDENGYISNEAINTRNEALATLADYHKIFFIDQNPMFDDEDGCLNQDLSFDNVHLYANAYVDWYQFLKEHAIDEEKMGLIR